MTRPDRPSDRALISCIRRGTPAQGCHARREIYDKYESYLWNYICKNTNCDEDAKEIFSNTWVTVFEKLPSFEWRCDTESKEPLQSWLFSIAQRKNTGVFSERGNPSRFG